MFRGREVDRGVLSFNLFIIIIKIGVRLKVESDINIDPQGPAWDEILIFLTFLTQGCRHLQSTPAQKKEEDDPDQPPVSGGGGGDG